jgi:hypothetical protein
MGSSIRPMSHYTFLRTILRYKGIAIIYQFRVTGFYANQGKLLKSNFRKNVMYIKLIFVKSLPWPKETCDSKLSFYHDIFFIAILCAKMSRMTWTLRP